MLATIAAVLLVQFVLAALVTIRYPESVLTVLRSIAVAIDAYSRIHPPAHKRTTRKRRVISRSHNQARQLDALSDRIESDVIRALVRLGSSESAARLHVLSLIEKGLLTPSMTIEQALAAAFSNLNGRTAAPADPTLRRSGLPH